MSPRWNWDFEDERRSARVPVSAALKVATGDRRAQLRRRRLGAALVFAMLVILLAVALSSAHHGGGSSAARAHPHGVGQQAAKPPTGTLEDGRKAVSSVLAYTPFAREGGVRGRDVALTFDDGPGPYTPAVLSVQIGRASCR